MFSLDLVFKMRNENLFGTAYLALACQMRWTGEVSIIIKLDWEKRI
jgi:hypothetical protein